MGNAGKAAATHKDGANGIDEVMHGVDVGGQISPVGHKNIISDSMQIKCA